MSKNGLSCETCQTALSAIPKTLTDGSKVNDFFCKTCGFTKKPYTHMEKMWVVLSVNPEDGVEGMLSMKGQDGQNMPLIAGDKARLASITEAGEMIVKQSGLPKVRLIEFGSRKVIKEISEDGDYTPKHKDTVDQGTALSLDEKVDLLLTQYVDSENESNKMSFNLSTILTKTIMSMSLKIGKEETKTFLDIQKKFLDTASDLMSDLK